MMKYCQRARVIASSLLLLFVLACGQPPRAAGARPPATIAASGPTVCALSIDKTSVKCQGQHDFYIEHFDTCTDPGPTAAVYPLSSVVELLCDGSCLRNSTGHVSCNGEVVSTTPFKSYGCGCGLTMDDSWLCHDGSDQPFTSLDSTGQQTITTPDLPPRDAKLSAISSLTVYPRQRTFSTTVYQRYHCGVLQTNMTVVCWGAATTDSLSSWNTDFTVNLPLFPLPNVNDAVDVAVGTGFVIVLRATGKVEQYGMIASAAASELFTMRASAVYASETHACALEDGTGRAVCVANYEIPANGDTSFVTPPDNARFSELSLTFMLTCGVLSASSPLQSTVASVAAGQGIVCFGPGSCKSSVCDCRGMPPMVSDSHDVWWPALRDGQPQSEYLFHAVVPGQYLLAESMFKIGHNIFDGTLIQPCATYDADKDKLVLRVTMGEYADYFRPLPGQTLCQLLTAAVGEQFLHAVADVTDDNFQTLAVNFRRTHVQFDNLLGGVVLDPDRTDDGNRQFAPFWGARRASEPGGCGHSVRGDAFSCARGYTMHVRRDPAALASDRYKPDGQVVHAGWSLYASWDGKVLVTADKYINGFGVEGDANFARPCGDFPNDSYRKKVRLQMGEHVDYVIPSGTESLCYLFRAPGAWFMHSDAPDGPWKLRNGVHAALLGGWLDNSPAPGASNGRTWGTFWGTHLYFEETGLCCHDRIGGAVGFTRPLTIWVTSHVV